MILLLSFFLTLQNRQNRRKFDFWGFRNDFFRDTHTTLPHGELDPSNLTFQKCDVNGRPLLDEGSTLGGLDKEAAVDNLRHFRSVTDCKASGIAIITSIVESLFALFKKTPFLLFLGSLVGFCEEAHVTHFHTYARETDALAAESEQFRDGGNWPAWLEGFSSNLFGVRFLKNSKLYLRHCDTRKIGDGFAQLWGDKVLTRQVDVAAYADNEGKSEEQDCVHPTHYEEMATKVFEYYLNMEHEHITDMNCLFGHSLVDPFIKACHNSDNEVYKLATRTPKGDLHEAHEKEGIYVVVRNIEGDDGKYKKVFYWFVAVCQPSAISISNSYAASSMSTRALDIANVIFKLLDWQWWPKHFNPFHISLGPVAPLPEPFLHPRPNTFNATLQFVRAPSDEDLEAEEVRVEQEFFGLGGSAVIPFDESDDETDFDFSNDVRE
jgi:hypothetical protein